MTTTTSAKIHSVFSGFTRRYYVRGLPRLLWNIRSALTNSENIYGIFGGMRLEIQADDYFQWMMTWGYYAPEFWPLFARYLREGDVFMDIGAQIGYFSLMARYLVGEKGLVIAVEPDPRAAAILERNIRRNSGGNIILVPKALADKEGTVELGLTLQMGWSTVSRDPCGATIQNRITVPTSTLDSIAREHAAGRTIRCVKIDVEGLEHKVLAGAEGILKDGRTVFIVEIKSVRLKENGGSARDVTGRFLDHGYRLYRIAAKHRFFGLADREELEPIRGTEVLGDCDILALAPRGAI